MSESSTATPVRPSDTAPGSVPTPSDPAQLPQASETATALCGAAHEYHTKTGATKSKPCLKAKGHSGPHSSRKPGEKIAMPTLDELSLEAEVVASDDLLEQVQERIRDARQLKADADVIASYERWVSAGKPAGFNDAIKAGAASRYIGAPQHVAAIRKILKNTDNVNGKAGVGGSKIGIHCRISAPKKLVDGNMAVYFVGVDKSEARQAAGATTTPAAPAPAPAATPAPTPRPPAARHGDKR